MMKLIEISNSIIKEELIQTVNARDLHIFLESKQDFSTWIKARIDQYNFDENIDYLLHKIMEQGSSGAKHKIEYNISIDMAKELSMVERTEKGKQARQYFIDCEKELKNSTVITLPTNFLEALRLLVVKEEENIQLKQDVISLGHTITNQAPAVEFAKAVRNLDGSCDMGEFAGVIGIGRNTLFKKMREDKLLMVTNRPYQKFKDSGVFVEIENIPFIDRQGKSHPTFQTRITGKGQILLENKYRHLNPFADFMVSNNQVDT